MPVSTAPPIPPEPPASSAQAKRQNRLFPAQELGLIEPPDRDQWQPPEQIMDDLNIAEGAVVADLGAGGGWFTIQLARRVAQNGLVYAEDVQAPMLDAILRRAQRENLSNVRTVLGTANDPKLPRGLDAAIIVDVYHEMACAAKPSCDEPVALLANVARSLKPQGRLGIVDFFPGEGGPGPAPEERVDPDTVVKAAAGGRLAARQTKGRPAVSVSIPSRLRPGACDARLAVSDRRTVLTIAGSDSSAGAGIQADLKTFAALGVYGTSAITAVTAQSTVGIVDMVTLSADFVTAQMEAIAGDITLHATKTGMLATAAIVEAVAATIKSLELPLVVVDPVMVSKSGTYLLDDDGVAMLRVELLPCSAVVTPNIPEAEILSGRRIESIEEARAAAFEIHQMGASAVVITGGHAPGNEIVDLLFDGHLFTELHTMRIDTPEYSRNRMHVRFGNRGAPGTGPFRSRRGGSSAGLRPRCDSACARHRSRTRTTRPFLEDTVRLKLRVCRQARG